MASLLLSKDVCYICFSNCLCLCMFGQSQTNDPMGFDCTGVWGGKGQGKSFQLELICKALDMEPIIMSAGELESEWAGNFCLLGLSRIEYLLPCVTFPLVQHELLKICCLE